MKVNELLCEAAKPKKKIPKPKPRPKKNLWFQDRNMWHADLQFAHAGGFDLHHDEEDEEQAKSFYATDPTSKICYGVWQGKHNRGITFHKPRHIAVVKHPRVRIKKFDAGPQQNNNITSRPVQG